MAEFCKQCAADLGLPNNDFTDVEEGEIVVTICEGCGPTNVTKDGECIYDCEKHHAPKQEVEA